MQPSSRPRSSLARSTLLKMGVRIAVIIALSTGVSYLHMLREQRTNAYIQLLQYVSERVQREQAIFLLAEDNHTILKKALEARIRRLSSEDVSTRFDRLFVPLPDSTVRNRAEGFDGMTMPGLFVPPGVTLDAEMRRRILASYDVLAQYGPAFSTRFVNTYIVLPEGPIVRYWPDFPTWSLEADPGFSFVGQSPFGISRPELNPERKAVWSGVYEDSVTAKSMVALFTPVDQDGRHFATIGHDIRIEELKARTLSDHLPGTYNILFQDDGQLIAYPEMNTKGGAASDNISDATRQQARPATQNSHLRAIIELVRNRPPGHVLMKLHEYDEYLAISRLVGPGWNFVTLLPGEVVSSAAFKAARYVLLFGLATLLLELLIMSWVLRQQITRPLQSFTHATDQIAAGDFAVSVKTSRDDELGRLAHGFELMAQEVQRREAALRQANDGLESRIQERTQELQEKNLKLEGALAQLEEAQALLVQKEKLASLGALVSGIAHEIKNPLNFVNNFAQLSVGLVEELREELKAHQAGRSASPPPELGELLEMLEQNVRKIDEHGRRADSIVRNMQLHARSASSERKPTDLNALVEEHLGLASEGMQVTNPGLRVAIHKQMDPTVGKVDLVPQDFGRALLNVLNNSLYALAEKKRSAGEGFTPEVTVSSRSAGSRVEIRIRDNGTGIPQKLHDKIFNPFFTTKPAGAGTGLGLSITYDIVVRQHQGELRIDSTEGQFTECLIVLQQSAVSA